MDTQEAIKPRVGDLVLLRADVPQGPLAISGAGLFRVHSVGEPYIDVAPLDQPETNYGGVLSSRILAVFRATEPASTRPDQG